MTDVTILDQIISELVGTCESDLQTKEEEFGIELSHSDYVYIDSHIFNCPSCGWWCELDEMAEGDLDEWICIDCHVEEE